MTRVHSFGIIQTPFEDPSIPRHVLLNIQDATTRIVHDPSPQLSNPFLFISKIFSSAIVVGILGRLAIKRIVPGEDPISQIVVDNISTLSTLFGIIFAMYHQKVYSSRNVLKYRGITSLGIGITMGITMGISYIRES